MRFNSAESDQKTLSFAPKLQTYRAERGNRIVSVSVIDFFKTYTPEKVYVSVLLNQHHLFTIF